MMIGKILLDNHQLSTKGFNIIVMILPYIYFFPMTVIMITKLKNIKKELKAIGISLLLTLLLCLILSLICIENIIIMVTLFSVLYLFIRDKMEIIKINKKVIIVYMFIFICIFGYKYTVRGNKKWIKIKDGDFRVINFREETGICYERVGFKKLICGEIINGKKEGKWIEYYDNGKKESEGTYSDGEKEGRWIEYYENGKKKLEVTYKNDEEIERIQYDEEIERIQYDEDGNRIEY